MKVAVISDTHYGARKGSKTFHAYFEKFYKEVFFPTLEERNIDTVIHMGDVFDSRKGIDFWSLQWAKRVVFDPLHKKGIKTHVLVGNHDAYYKNTNNVNSVESLLREYDNVIPVANTSESIIDNTKILFIPWICSDNEEHTVSMIRGTDAKLAMGHLDLNGFLAYRGHTQQAGMDPSVFQKFSKVFSGHFHTRSNDGKVFYLGNPYQIYWNDLNDPRGFTILDTDTFETESIDNPFEIFKRISYEDTDSSSFDFNSYKDKIVKLVVNKRSDVKKFEVFLDNLYNAGIHELKIIETIDIMENSGVDLMDNDSSEDTLSILNEYIDSSGESNDKSKLKNIIQEIYKSAFEVAI